MRLIGFGHKFKMNMMNVVSLHVIAQEPNQNLLQSRLQLCGSSRGDTAALLNRGVPYRQNPSNMLLCFATWTVRKTIIMCHL